MNVEDCRHFTGVANKTCDKGVSYETVMEGRKIPCLKKYRGNKECVKFEYYTEAEIKAYHDKIEKQLNNMRLVGPVIRAIKEKYHGQNHKGELECPVCKKKLFFTIASINDHVWMSCETKGCIGFIQ